MTGCKESSGRSDIAEESPEGEASSSADAAATGAPDIAEQLAIAEAMIDAFYSFDPKPLSALLKDAGLGIPLQFKNYRD